MSRLRRILGAVVVFGVSTASVRGQQLASHSYAVPNGAIQIDGEVDDWSAVTAIDADAEGDGAGGYDLSQLFIAHDDSNYYVRVQLYSDEVNFGGTAAGMWTVFDTDKDAGTGLSGFFASGLGAEWNGSGVSQFNGWNSSGGHTGSILGAGVAGARSLDQLEYEYAIPRAVLGSDSFFVAVQSEFGEGDLLPNDPGSYFEYHADPVVQPPKPYRYELDAQLANPPASAGVLGDVLGNKLNDGIADDANWLTGGQFVGTQDPMFVPGELAGDNELPQPRVEFTFESAQTLQSVEITYLVDDEAKINAPDAVSIAFSQGGAAFGGDIASFDFDDADDEAELAVGDGAIRTLNVGLGGVVADQVRLDFLNDFEWTAIGEISWVFGIVGDIDQSGSLDIADLDVIQAAVTGGTTDAQYDYNGSGDVNYDDVLFWVNDLAKTWVGDANLDGLFSSSDFVSVFQAGKFERNVDATWSEGDWTGDRRFDSSDFVAAFQQGGYEIGPKTAVAAVPEPMGPWGLCACLLGLLRTRRGGGFSGR